MLIKWICLVLIAVLLYEWRCYWSPVWNRITNGFRKKQPVHVQIQLFNEQLYSSFEWEKSSAISPFIGSLDYEVSRLFYSEIGFKVDKGEKYCKVSINKNLYFWLQRYANKEWLNNSMVFLDVPNIKFLKSKLKALEIERKYKNVKISETHTYDWGKEFFMHDPSGVLWHFCEFN